MQVQGHAAVRRVIDLVRHHEVSDTERRELFAALIGELNTSDATHGDASIHAHDTAPNRTKPHQAAKPTCQECGGRVEAEPLSMRCYVRLGVTACKACIDAALVARYGPHRRVSFLDDTYA